MLALRPYVPASPAPAPGTASVASRLSCAFRSLLFSFGSMGTAGSAPASPAAFPPVSALALAFVLMFVRTPGLVGPRRADITPEPHNESGCAAAAPPLLLGAYFVATKSLLSLVELRLPAPNVRRSVSLNEIFLVRGGLWI